MAVLRETAAGQFVTGPSDSECPTAIPDCYRPTCIADGLADFDATAPARLHFKQVGSYALRALASNARVPVKSAPHSDLGARDFLLMGEDADSKSSAGTKFGRQSRREPVTKNGSN